MESVKASGLDAVGYGDRERVKKTTTKGFQRGNISPIGLF